jgi:hypothetical protein
VRHVAYDPNARGKPHLNIGTIGHVDHGKTTLTAAITRVRPSVQPFLGNSQRAVTCLMSFYPPDVTLAVVQVLSETGGSTFLGYDQIDKVRGFVQLLDTTRHACRPVFALKLTCAWPPWLWAIALQRYSPGPTVGALHGRLISWTPENACAPCRKNRIQPIMLMVCKQAQWKFIIKGLHASAMEVQNHG